MREISYSSPTACPPLGRPACRRAVPGPRSRPPDPRPGRRRGHSASRTKTAPGARSRAGPPPNSAHSAFVSEIAGQPSNHAALRAARDAIPHSLMATPPSATRRTNSTTSRFPFGCRLDAGACAPCDARPMVRLETSRHDMVRLMETEDSSSRSGSACNALPLPCRHTPCERALPTPGASSQSAAPVVFNNGETAVVGRR